MTKNNNLKKGKIANTEDMERPPYSGLKKKRTEKTERCSSEKEEGKKRKN